MYQQNMTAYFENNWQESVTRGSYEPEAAGRRVRLSDIILKETHLVTIVPKLGSNLVSSSIREDFKISF